MPTFPFHLIHTVTVRIHPTSVAERRLRSMGDGMPFVDDDSVSGEDGDTRGRDTQAGGRPREGARGGGGGGGGGRERDRREDSRGRDPNLMQRTFRVIISRDAGGVVTLRDLKGQIPGEPLSQRNDRCDYMWRQDL